MQNKFVDTKDVVESCVRYQLLSDEAKAPARNGNINLDMASDDVGLDLFVSKVVDIKHDTDDIPVSCTVKTDTVVVVPPGHSIVLAPRSSLAKSGWFIANTIGIIDNGYRGELLVMLARLPGWGVERKAVSHAVRGINREVVNIVSMEEIDRKTPIVPVVGSRVAQCIVVKDFVLPVVESAGDLSSEDTGRGKKGFGSSGH